MPRQKLKDSIREFEKAVEGAATDKKFVLKLYVSGATTRSSRAIENIRNFCEEHLKGRYELEIIDIYQQPELLEKDQVVAAPTLIKQLPPAAAEAYRGHVRRGKDPDRTEHQAQKGRRETDYENGKKTTERTGAGPGKRGRRAEGAARRGAGDASRDPGRGSGCRYRVHAGRRPGLYAARGRDARTG